MHKKILLSITGSIAAYKSIELLRLLQKHGHTVRCVLTESAKQFVTPMTLQTLSGHPIYSELFDLEQEQQMSHITLARWADMILIAPATANCIAKLAHGLVDDLLSTLCLATTSPIIVAPAMNTKMWEHPATQQNLTILKQRNIQIIAPEFGEQACGEIGLGRMAEPEHIFQCLKLKTHLTNKKVLITAGPTREPIDPVRYISNRSSGKMGYALAAAFQHLGADVTLISGPVSLNSPSGIRRIDVITAEEMYKTVMSEAPRCDLFISVAAVADYRIKEVALHKIKKLDNNKTLELVKNPDILAAVGELPNKPFIIGFSAETENLEKNAKQKLKSKNCDLIIANLVGKNTTFDSDQNEVFVIDKNGLMKKISGSKIVVANKIATYVETLQEKKYEKI